MWRLNRARGGLDLMRSEERIVPVGILDTQSMFADFSRFKECLAFLTEDFHRMALLMDEAYNPLTNPRRRCEVLSRCGFASVSLTSRFTQIRRSYDWLMSNVMFGKESEEFGVLDITKPSFSVMLQNSEVSQSRLDYAMVSDFSFLPSFAVLPKKKNY